LGEEPLPRLVAAPEERVGTLCLRLPTDVGKMFTGVKRRCGEAPQAIGLAARACP